MNHAKVTDLDYINFLVASPLVFSCTEAARVQPDQPRRAAHDALTRLLHRLDPDPAPLWDEAKQHVSLHHGLLLIDDTTLDKPYAQQIELVHRHWSGKQHHVVSDINLVTLLWSDGTDAIPCDYRLYDKPVDGVTKNEYFRAMLQTAKERDFHPRFVAFDSWYSSLENLKTVRSLDWHWLTRLKSNRQVNPDGSGNQGTSAAQPYWLGSASLPPAGAPSDHERDELVRGKDGHHSFSAQGVPVADQPDFGRIGSEPLNCVTPIGITPWDACQFEALSASPAFGFPIRQRQKC